MQGHHVILHSISALHMCESTRCFFFPPICTCIFKVQQKNTVVHMFQALCLFFSMTKVYVNPRADQKAYSIRHMQSVTQPTAQSLS